jgi:hypothetical protein
MPPPPDPLLKRGGELVVSHYRAIGCLGSPPSNLVVWLPRYPIGSLVILEGLGWLRTLGPLS